MPDAQGNDLPEAVLDAFLEANVQCPGTRSSTFQSQYVGVRTSLVFHFTSKLGLM